MPRARSTRARYPGGKLKPELASPTLVRRIIDQARRDASNPLLGSELGRLRLTGVLDDRQVAAGQRFGELVGQYDRIKGIPNRVPKSPAWERGAGKSTRADLDQRLIDQAISRYLSAYAALAAIGRRVQGVVVNVTIYDDCAPSFDQPYLVRGLNGLAAHFGLLTKA